MIKSIEIMIVIIYLSYGQIGMEGFITLTIHMYTSV